jgi:hypothetical protein
MNRGSTTHYMLDTLLREEATSVSVIGKYASSDLESHNTLRSCRWGCFRFGAGRSAACARPRFADKVLTAGHDQQRVGLITHRCQIIQRVQLDAIAEKHALQLLLATKVETGIRCGGTENTMLKKS